MVRLIYQTPPITAHIFSCKSPPMMVSTQEDENALSPQTLNITKNDIFVLQG